MFTKKIIIKMNDIFIEMSSNLNRPKCFLLPKFQNFELGQYDWVFSVDCDCLFVNMTQTVDFMIYRQAGIMVNGQLELDPNINFMISEDGRGLAGGQWMVDEKFRKYFG